MQRLHNFHPRPESPLHLPTEEPVLGNLKFSAKGTKREVFGMTIPNELINDVIRGADYYDAYLKKVAKHQQYLAGEEVSDPDSPAAKPTKQTKPKPTKQSKPTKPKAATKKSKSALAKPQEKKRKPVSEPSEVSPLAKRAKAGKVVKKRNVKSYKQLVDEFIDEGVPAARPRLKDTKEAILQKEVPGKGKEKVGEEQAAQVLLNLQTFFLQRKEPLLNKYPNSRRSHIPTETRQFVEDSLPYMPSLDCLAVTLSLMKKCLQWLEVGSNEGQLGPDLNIDPLQHQPRPEHIDEGFTAAAYPDLQENLKLMVDEQVIPEEPASSTGMLSSLQHLTKDFSFGDQFLNDKPSEADNEKTTADTKAESMEIDQKINESVKEVVISSVKHAMRAPLRARFKDLPTSDMKEILLQRMLEENYDKGHANHRVAYEALQDSIRRDESEDFDVDKAQEETKKKSKQDSPNTPPGSPPSPPPPPPPPSGASGASGTTGASDSSQAPPLPPPSSSTHQGGRDHIPAVNLRQSWWKPLTEDRPATPEPAWTIPSSNLTMPTNN
ncbi:hypothetical protein Tco_0646466 [Tanacetum coccineum]